MTSALTIARRELAAYFHAPLAYAFLALFIVGSQVFYVLTVNPAGRADMNYFFDWLPWWSVVFASLVTMRSWAEERQENTYEMLLTFPMRDRDLVLGKFLAAFAFLATGIACTLTLPVLLAKQGDPDFGPILAGYFGALLVAGAWSATGIFLSGLTRSQPLAAILSVGAGLAWLATGTDTVTQFTDGNLAGVGSFLRSVFGGYARYTTFTRGIVELVDVAYFVGWAFAFLSLNTLHLTLRRHPQAGAPLGVGTALTLGSVLLWGRLTHDTTWARADLTEEGVYTLSPGTLRILGRAKDPVRATLIVSPQDEMPSELKSLQRDIEGRLQEIRAASGGRLVIHTEYLKREDLVAPDEEETDPEDAAIAVGDGAAPADGPKKPATPDAERSRRRAAKNLAMGVQPLNVMSYDAGSATSQLVVASLRLTHREREETIDALLPARLPEFESLLANTVARIIRERPPRIALHLGKEAMDPNVERMLRQMGRPTDRPSAYEAIGELLRADKIEVLPTDLTSHSPMPEEYDAFLCFGPEGLEERARWEVNRALVAGKPTLLALHRYEWKYQMGRRGVEIRAPREIESGLDDVLAAQGIRLSRDVLLDMNHEPLTIRTGTAADLLGGATVSSPTHIVVGSASIGASPLTERLGALFYLWGTGLVTDTSVMTKQGLSSTVLLRSGEKSWTVPPVWKGMRLDPAGHEFTPQVLALDVRGPFADAYAGKPRPSWELKLDFGPDGRPRPAPADTPETPVTAAPGRLLVTGSGWMFQGGILGFRQFQNRDFLFRCVDALTLDPDLVEVRAKQIKIRALDKPTPTMGVLQVVLPLVLVPFVVLGAGLAVGVLRLRRRESWMEKHGR